MFAIKEARRAPRVDLLVNELGGSWSSPIARFPFTGALEAKNRAETYRVENDLF
jgi:hypothetical protein